MSQIEPQVEIRHQAPQKSMVEVILTSTQKAPTTIYIEGKGVNSWTSTSPSFVITQKSETK